LKVNPVSRDPKEVVRNFTIPSVYRGPYINSLVYNPTTDCDKYHLFELIGDICHSRRSLDIFGAN